MDKVHNTFGTRLADRNLQRRLREVLLAPDRDNRHALKIHDDESFLRESRLL